MTAAVTPEDRHHIGAAPLRVLLAVHGYEPPGWAEETCRVISTWASPSVRVLAVLDVPSPPFTSLIAPARQAYDGARAEWTEIERCRLEAPIAALMPGLPRATEVSRIPATRGDLARTVAEQARTWHADIVVVGAPTRRPWSWLRPGPVHERVVRLAGCTVLVTAPPLAVTRGSRRRLAVPRPTSAAAPQRA